MEHNDRYIKFKKLYENFKEFQTHKYYAPNAEGYLKTKDNFDELKKQL